MKKARKYIVLLLVAAALYAGGRIFLYSRMERVIADKIAEAQTRNISISYEFLDVNYWRGDVIVGGLVMRIIAADSVCRICGEVSRIEVGGVSILPLIFDKELELDHVKVVAPSVTYDSRYSAPDRKGRKPNSLKGVKVKRIVIDSARLDLVDSVTRVSNTNACADLDFKDLKLSFEDETLGWSVGGANMRNFKADFKRSLYHVTVDHVAYDRGDKTFRVDSLAVIPTEARHEFAKRIGHQVDQFNCVIPSLVIDGFEMDSLDASVLRASHAGLSFKMEVYRDKRYPRKHRKPRRMPVTFMREMNIKFSIDSISLYPSSVTYEELPENGDAIGKIFFNDLKAGIYNLSNDSSRGPAEMKVHSRFMDAGNLQAHFTFPTNEKTPYTVRGSLTDFSLPKINSMLVPVGNIEVESGVMREMKFHFSYNAFRSDGELEVNYSDLKVISLKKDDRKTPNKLLSLLIGAFVKKDINAKDSKDQRTGQILWERDTQKGILNYWWKSVLSGVKSVYNLDKIMKGDGKK